MAVIMSVLKELDFYAVLNIKTFIIYCGLIVVLVINSIMYVI